MKQEHDCSALASVDIEGVNKEELVDVGNITLDTSIPQQERAGWILEAVKNPYCFRVGDMAVKLEFSPDAPPLQDVFADFLKRKKSGL